MSLHPSLKIDKAGAQQRSVLSRIERIKELMKKGLWTGSQVTALPKTKVLKVKAKKKAVKKEEAAAGTAAAAPAKAVAPKAAAPAKKA